MKKVLVILMLCGGFTSMVKAQETVKTEVKAKKKKAPITFKTLTIERNNIPYGADETFTFSFKNTGKEPIIISNVQTSCGCTTAKKPEAPVAPKKSADISVKYDTKRVGQFTKTITVTSNVSEPIVLTIKGTVLAEENKTPGKNGQY
jgi:archaellum component FlaG (FlaF/FlaG flagellin family)